MAKTNKDQPKPKLKFAKRFTLAQPGLKGADLNIDFQGIELTEFTAQQAKALNPHHVVKAWIAVCITCNKYISDGYTLDKEQAEADCTPHLRKGHVTDLEFKYVTV